MSYDEITAPADWQCVDFISDVHLQASEPENFLAWCKYLAQSSAQAIFILGDLFEVWIGDDVLGTMNEANPHARHEALHFEQRCCQALRNCAQHRQVYFLHGNRDFLLGQGFAQACGMHMLSDPCVLSLGGQRYLLSHGDALCLADVEYQQFRSTVRSAAWQASFLATPLQERLEQARMMRQASELRKKELAQAGQAWIDIDAPAAVQWMDAAGALHFIHGHTHEGRDHVIRSAQGLGTRHVLPDWQLAQHPMRGYALRLRLAGGAVVTQQVAVA